MAVHYHQHIKDAFEEWGKRGIPPFTKNMNDNPSRIQNHIPVDRNLPTLDQLEQYLITRFDELSILPKSFFLHCYPFILSETFNYYEIPFTMITDNPEVFELLKNISVEGGQVEDPTGKFIRNQQDEKNYSGYLKLLDKILFIVYVLKTTKAMKFNLQTCKWIAAVRHAVTAACVGRDCFKNFTMIILLLRVQLITR